MKKQVLALFLALLIGSYSVLAQNESFFSVYNIAAKDITAVTIQYLAYGIPEQGVFTLENKILIDTLIMQLEEMKITKNENSIINGSSPIDTLKSTRGGFEISFKTADNIRSFWIMNDGQIAEYSKLLSRLPQFDYHFVSTSFRLAMESPKNIEYFRKPEAKCKLGQ